MQRFGDSLIGWGWNWGWRLSCFLEIDKNFNLIGVNCRSLLRYHHFSNPRFPEGFSLPAADAAYLTVLMMKLVSIDATHLRRAILCFTKCS